jgi:hypothetical protein
MRRHHLIPLAGALLATTIAACAEPARRPVEVNPEAAMAAAPRPAWVDGEFEEGRVFWGTAGVAITDGEANATAAAIKVATDNLGDEIQLLGTALAVDHEEQVAEVISRYPLEDFEAHMAGAKATAIEKVTVVDTFVDSVRQPNHAHALVTLSIDDFFAAVAAREELPREQKKRIEDYGHFFRDNVMSNLGR